MSVSNAQFRRLCGGNRSDHTSDSSCSFVRRALLKVAKKYAIPVAIALGGIGLSNSAKAEEGPQQPPPVPLVQPTESPQISAGETPQLYTVEGNSVSSTNPRVRNGDDSYHDGPSVSVVNRTDNPDTDISPAVHINGPARVVLNFYVTVDGNRFGEGGTFRNEDAESPDFPIPDNQWYISYSINDSRSWTDIFFTPERSEFGTTISIPQGYVITRPVRIELEFGEGENIFQIEGPAGFLEVVEVTRIVPEPVAPLPRTCANYCPTTSHEECADGSTGNWAIAGETEPVCVCTYTCEQPDLPEPVEDLRMPFFDLQFERTALSGFTNGNTGGDIYDLSARGRIPLGSERLALSVAAILSSASMDVEALEGTASLRSVLGAVELGLAMIRGQHFIEFGAILGGQAAFVDLASVYDDVELTGTYWTHGSSVNGFIYGGHFRYAYGEFFYVDITGGNNPFVPGTVHVHGATPSWTEGAHPSLDLSLQWLQTPVFTPIDQQAIAVPNIAEDAALLRALLELPTYDMVRGPSSAVITIFGGIQTDFNDHTNGIAGLGILFRTRRVRGSIRGGITFPDVAPVVTFDLSILSHPSASRAEEANARD